MQTSVNQSGRTEQDKGEKEWKKNPGLPKVNRFAEKQQANGDSSSTNRQDPDKPNPKDEALEKVSRALEELNDALGQGKSAQLETYLKFLAKFHNYSINNSMLISLQCPEATHVAGYDKWKELGRQVRKGERGIGIFAPVMGKKKIEVENAKGEKEEKEVKRLSGFRIAKVFDVSQTDGEAVPETASISGDPGDHLPRLESIVAEDSIALRYDYPAQGALGVSTGGEIIVRPDLGPAETFAVLAHELAHEMLHKGERRNETDKKVRETEAEAVAFVVSTAMGLDTTTRSSDYIALYRGDSKVLKESLDFIQKTASKIIWGLTKEKDTGSK